MKQYVRLTLPVLTLLAFSLMLVAPAVSASCLLQEAPPTEEKQEEQQQDKQQQEDKQEEEAGKDFSKGEKDADATARGNAGAESGENDPPRNRRRRESRGTSNSRAASGFLDVFRPIVADAARATVQIKNEDNVVALGTIVDSTGYILTKQSELKSPISCELNDGRNVSAYVYGVHAASDLALLKIEAENLPVAQWAETDTLEIGHWLATVKDPEPTIGIGTVGVLARLIKPQSGFMGVNLRQTERGVMITNVSADSPAEEGGLKSGDIVQKVNGESFTEIEKLIENVKSHPPGETIRLSLIRDESEIIADVTLGEERSLNPLFERSNQQNTMGGNKLSQRRQNFPLAVQHDTFLKPEECGGPVVNIDGEVVGINIARQGRVSSLMLPSSLVLSIIPELRSGQLAPALVNKERIEEINRMLQELNTRVALSPMNSSSLNDKVNKLSKEEKELREKLEQTQTNRIRAEVELEQASSSFKIDKDEIERLKKEREKLVTGIR